MGTRAEAIVAGKYYTLRGLSQAFDGLDVKVSSSDETGFVEIERVRNRGIMIGDRPWSMPITPGMLFVDPQVLVECSIDGEMEFDCTNPFGDHMYDAKYDLSENIAVKLSEYVDAVSVTVYDMGVDPPRMMLSKNFFGLEKKNSAVMLIEQVCMRDVPVDELVFRLEEI